MKDFMHTLCMYHPQFIASTRIYKILEEIATVREQIRASLVKVPWVPSLVRDAMARSAWGSTAIEGCTLSLEAVKGLLEGKPAIGYPNLHVRMAKNYLNALTWIEKRENVRVISEKDLLKLHQVIGEGVVDEGPIGEYRKIAVRAGNYVCPPWRQVPKLTQELMLWLYGPASLLPAVFSSAILHLRLVEIHPFRDGNGRVARALSTWQLYRMGFDTLHIFALDEVLLENRSYYIKNLERVQLEGKDLGGWLEFMAEAVLETLERVQKRIQALGISGKEPLSLTIRQEKFLQILREKGTMSIQEITSALKVTSPGAHYALKPLIKRNIVKIIGSYKQTRYTLS